MVRRDVTLIVMFAAMIFLFLCNFMSLGIVGEFFSNLMFGLTGFLAYFLPVVVFALYLYDILMEEVDPKIVSKVAALSGLCVIISVFLEMAAVDLSQQTGFDPVGIYTRCAENRNGGGLIGGAIAFVLYSLLKTVGMVIVLVVLIIVCIYVIGQRSFLELFRDRAKDAQAARRERLEAEEQYRREHPEEFEEEFEEEAEEGFEEEAEEGYEEKHRKKHREKRREDCKDKYREEYEEDVQHYRGIVGSTDLSDGNGFERFAENAEPGEREDSAAQYDPSAAAGSEVPPCPEDTSAGESDQMQELSAQEPQTGRFHTDPFHTDRFYSEALHEIRPEDFLDEEPAEPASGGETFSRSFEDTWDAGVEESAYGMETSDQPFENAGDAGADVNRNLEENPFLRGHMEEEQGGGSPDQSDEAQEEPFLCDLTPGPAALDQSEQSDPEPAADNLLGDVPVHTEREEGTSEINRTLDEEEREPALQPAAPAGTEDAGKPDGPSGTVEYVFPPIDLLHPGKGASADSDEELRRTAQTLQSTLASFGVKVKITDISQGPSVTRYEMLPETGVKVSRIVSLSDDIKLALAATDIRIEAPIPGKSAIGIEVPNREPQPVMLRDIVDTQEFRSQKSRLAFAVGKDIAGRPVYSDIAKMPHVLIAGATGAGKSVCINTIIMSILYHARPDEVKFIMVDPKVVELSVYNGIPHLLIPVVTNPQKATAALNWAVAEMEARYRAFADARVRDISSYNALVKEQEAKGEPRAELHFMPQIVVIVDELADLMMAAKNDVETAICRLAQLARAAGIHLIIATQRPSVDVITGLIKANMPSRIAFRVSSGVDSRTILDMVGAEKLLGRGDMLFFPQGLPKPTRVQGCFVSDEEVNDVASFLIRSCGASDEEQQRHQEEIDAMEAQGSIEPSAGAAGGSTASPEPSVDELFGGAGAFIIEKNNASIGLLQRRYRIGFNRAARIMDQLCDAGVVSESEGTKSRNVLMTPAEFAAYCAENGIRIPEQI